MVDDCPSVEAIGFRPAGKAPFEGTQLDGQVGLCVGPITEPDSASGLGPSPVSDEGHLHCPSGQPLFPTAYADSVSSSCPSVGSAIPTPLPCWPTAGSLPEDEATGRPDCPAGGTPIGRTDASASILPWALVPHPSAQAAVRTRPPSPCFDLFFGE
ncbi:unnamed protein product, partial [Protopolystoma xenopodis]